MMKFNFFGSALIALVAISFTPANAVVEVPVESDSRIKTVVYNENEVYTFITRHGFQSNIEFAQEEVIETISIGDAIGWQVTPAGRRIFIKPLQRNGVTNLTVITNKHSYQFELVATDSSGRYSNHAYVLKFFYPDSPEYQFSDDRTRGSLRPVSSTAIPELPVAPAPYAAAPAPAVTALPGDSPSAPSAMVSQGLNFNYSLTGPDSLAPTKIYDDSRSTYFEMPVESISGVKFFSVSSDGAETPVSARQQGNLAVVDQISPKIIIRKGSELITVYNENLLNTGSMVR